MLDADVIGNTNFHGKDLKIVQLGKTPLHEHMGVAAADLGLMVTDFRDNERQRRGLLGGSRGEIFGI